jgi:hypothetical protein
MPGRTRLACVTVVVALAAAGAGAGEAHALILKRLDYESGNFRQWTAVQAVSGGARIVRAPVRQGHYAARFLVRPGDRPVVGGERAEVYKMTGEVEGTESWWRWSTYFPTGFRPNRNTAWNIFTQWHHTGGTCSPPVSFGVNSSTSSPRLELRVWGGRLTSTCDTTSRRAWRFATLGRNRWYNFIFHVKWSSSSSTGFVQLWVNGTVRIPKTYLPTLYRGLGVYVKQGFYRAHSNLTTTIYHDGLRRYQP